MRWCGSYPNDVTPGIDAPTSAHYGSAVSRTRTKRLVLKIGSNVLSGPNGLRSRFFSHLADQVAQARAGGSEIVIVSSGAIASAMAELGIAEKPALIPEKQALAALGQPLLMHTYTLAFRKKGLRVAQLLLTQPDLDDRKRFLNARHALAALLARGITPIINENDSVVVDEIKFGDNDRLSAHVAHLAEADALMILTDIDGLYDKNPDTHPDAKLISHVSGVDEKIHSFVFAGGSGKGTGGMASKIEAACIAATHRIPLYITNGFRKNFLTEYLQGILHGTFFHLKG